MARPLAGVKLVLLILLFTQTVEGGDPWTLGIDPPAHHSVILSIFSVSRIVIVSSSVYGHDRPRDLEKSSIRW